ncbi:TIGR01621 family pseudouridine synthase [Thaumasiovibrio subtropicus]|uniref:TIGR01621 family pseudouridine synthase n=1 Tax=Thaumasiovibrio subtropicus TaxID=1891207 RepID=UPI000B34D0A5|nr:TIGR01621 family pseudouridine synthase [Thaumasiovibrio subtropicus]
MFTLLHVDDDFVIIDKHPNVSVHKDDGETMLVGEVAKAVGDEHLYLVHRLDKMTSGLLMLARHGEAAASLSKLFADRLVQKYYLAIGEKKPTKKQGLISGDMERSRRSSWKLLPTKKNPAITQFFSVAGDAGQRIFICKPHTGKTHQIRVALKSVGAAILGDPIYGQQSINRECDRGYLHAYGLQFEYQGRQLAFVAPPSIGNEWQSASVQAAVAAWQYPENLPWPVIKPTRPSKGTR